MLRKKDLARLSFIRNILSSQPLCIICRMLQATVKMVSKLNMQKLAVKVISCNTPLACTAASWFCPKKE